MRSRRERGSRRGRSPRASSRSPGEHRGGDVQGSDEGARSHRGRRGHGRCSCCATSTRSSRTRGRAQAARPGARPARRRRRACILLSPVMKIPPELEKEVAVIDWDLPDRARDRRHRRQAAAGAAGRRRAGAGRRPAGARAHRRGGARPHLVEAENVFAKSIVRTKTFDLETILEEKKHIIRKSGLLEYYEPRGVLDDIGGLEIAQGLAAEAAQRVHLARARLRAAAAQGHPAHRRARQRQVADREGGRRGVADAAAAARRRQDLRRARRRVGGEHPQGASRPPRRSRPAVLWLDELEKGFSGTGSSNMTDGGTTSRVFGIVRHLAAGEDLAGVRDRDREQRARSCRPSCCARAASTRSSSSICRLARSASTILDIHLARRSARPGDSSTWTSWSTRRPSSPAPSSSRR